MIIYHEAKSEDLRSILTNGLKKSSRGELGSDDIVVKTDKLLDKHYPKSLLEAGVSRDNNIYGYLTTNTGIVDIYSGDDNHRAAELSEQEKEEANDRILFRIQVTASRCFVSDLNQYDKLKHALQNNANEHHINKLISQYWNSLTRLDQYQSGKIYRPEVMVTYDISPEDMTVVSDI